MKLFINRLSLIPRVLSDWGYILTHPNPSSYKGDADCCAILGNGPSLKQTLVENFNFFKNKKKMCVNNFAHSEYFNKIKPDYYILIDPACWSKKMSKRVKKIYLKTTKIMEKEVTWKMVLFLPLDAKPSNPFKEVPLKNKNIKIHYFSLIEPKGIKSIKFLLLKYNLVAPPASNVLVAGIFLSLNMGFKKTYIVGADHSWHENFCIGDDNILYLRDVHFYDKNKPSLVPFYKDAEESHKKTFRIDEIFAVLSRTFGGYLELEEYSKYLGLKIYNASKVSYIDAFKRYKINKDHVSNKNKK